MTAKVIREDNFPHFTPHNRAQLPCLRGLTDRLLALATVNPTGSPSCRVWRDPQQLYLTRAVWVRWGISMTKSVDIERSRAAMELGGRPPEFVCAGEDLKDILHALTRQIASSEQRNTQTLDFMRERLELLGRDAGQAREQASPEHSPAFGRIEDRAHQLADRIATVNWERELKRPETSPAAVAEPAIANHSAIDLLSQSVPGDVTAPWDHEAAEALARLYESGQADMGGHAHMHHGDGLDLPSNVIKEPVPEPEAKNFTHEPIQFDATTQTHQNADRAWLESRFAEIAGRIEQSFVSVGADNAFVAFDDRLGQLEARFGHALESVATRSDVEGLRIVEAHINELSTQFEQANLHLARLDNVELQLGDLLHQVSDDRFAHLFAQHAGVGPAGTSDEEIEAVAMAVADRIANRLPQHIEPAHAAGTEAAVVDLQRLIEGFVAGQRDNEEHTSSMLDTMQQAMIRMLDRMDAIENSAPSYPAQQASFAPAPQMTPAPQHRFDPSFADEFARDAHLATTAETSMPVEPVKASTALNANAAKEDFRAAAIADARRAARKVASQSDVDEPAPKVESGRVRRSAPSVNGPALDVPGDVKGGNKTGIAASGSAGAPRSRVPLMVAGVALVAAIGLLAASVGLNRGLPFMTGGKAQQQAAQQRGALTIDNGTETVEQGVVGPETPTPSIGANGGAQLPSQAAAPQPPAIPGMPARKRAPSDMSIENLNDNRVGATEVGAAPQEAMVRAPASTTSLPMGMTMTPARAVPTDSDLARMRQQRNLSSLSSQLAAVQAHAQAIPASLMPNAGMGAEPDVATINDGSKPSEMPPAFIGPISLRTAASKGDASAEFEVAARFAEGRGITQDFKQAMVWYQRSAQRGFAPAQYRLGTLYERGIGTKADSARAKIWYGRAAEQGHVKAMHNLAVLSSGRDQSADYPVAVTWFTAASERGLTDSQYNLGVLHESGLGLPRDFKQAYYWLSLAARNGDKEAARRRDQIRMKLEEADVTAADQTVAAWQAKPSDSAINDARVAGEGWKARQSVGR